MKHKENHEEDFVQDISLPEIKDKVLIDHPQDLEMVKRLKRTTNARLGVGRAGDRFKTETLLNSAPITPLRRMPSGQISTRRSSMRWASTRCRRSCRTRKNTFAGRIAAASFPQRPWRPSSGTASIIDVQLVVADGLSGFAINANLRDIYAIMMDGFAEKGYRVGTPIFVRYSRVATMDKISEASVPRSRSSSSASVRALRRARA